MDKDEAKKIVEGAFGRRPDLPSGKDFVDEVRHGKPQPDQSNDDYFRGFANGVSQTEVECQARIEALIDKLEMLIFHDHDMKAVRDLLTDLKATSKGEEHNGQADSQ